MSLNARISGVWKALQARIRVASTWKTPDSVHIRVDGAWKQVWQNFTVDYPASASGSASGFASAGFVETDTYAVPTFTGGSGSYTYLWTYQSGDAGIAISSATVQRPSWSAVCEDGVPRSTVWLVTVTDTVTSQVATDTMSISLSWDNLT